MKIKKIAKRLKRKFITYRPPQIRENATRFSAKERYWGHSIELGVRVTDDVDKSIRMSVYGILTPTPCIGDELVIPMKSGRDALAVFISAQGKSDPADWFNGEVEYLGYVDEFQDRKVTKEIHPNAFNFFKETPDA